MAVRILHVWNTLGNSPRPYYSLPRTHAHAGGADVGADDLADCVALRTEHPHNTICTLRRTLAPRRAASAAAGPAGRPAANAPTRVSSVDRREL